MSVVAEKEKSFDCIRVLAMASIILCHFFQIIGSYGISSWLNTGVQVFFILSARLICTKKFDDKEDIFRFFKTRVLRIFVPLWIYFACIIPVLYVAGRGPQVSTVIMYFTGLMGFARFGVLGLGHLWYVTVLLMCYLLVPVLYKVAVYCEKTDGIKAIALKALVPSAAILVFLFTKYNYYGVDIACFSAAYFMFYKILSNENRSKGILLKVLPVTLIPVCAKIILDASTDRKENAFYSGVFETTVKAVLAVFLFFLLYNIFNFIKCKKIYKPIGFLSKISYEIYIVHQFILLALYEFVPFFKSSAVGRFKLLICSLALIFVNAVILYYLKIFLEKRIFKK